MNPMRTVSGPLPHFCLMVRVFQQYSFLFSEVSILACSPRGKVYKIFLTCAPARCHLHICVSTHRSQHQRVALYNSQRCTSLKTSSQLSAIEFRPYRYHPARCRCSPNTCLSQLCSSPQMYAFTTTHVLREKHKSNVQSPFQFFQKIHVIHKHILKNTLL